MTKEKWIEEFLIFLIEKEILHYYISALKKSKKLNKDTIHHNILTGNVKGWINKSFNWSGTPQGHNYWALMSEEWQKRVDTLRHLH